MFLRKNKNEVPADPIPKELKLWILKKILIINNTTNQEFEIESSNEFGMNWEFTNDYKVICIQQFVEYNNNKKWYAKSRLVGWSVLNTDFIQVTVPNPAYVEDVSTLIS